MLLFSGLMVHDLDYIGILPEKIGYNWSIGLDPGAKVQSMKATGGLAAPSIIHDVKGGINGFTSSRYSQNYQP